MEEKSVGRSFLILSVAGILVKILSAAYVPVLKAIIGDDAIGIYQASYTYFVFILAITSLGAQPAVTKVVSELRAMGHHKDALRAMKIARKYLIIIGGAITVIFILIAKPLAKATDWERASLSLIFLAPTILFSCILAAYRGYLQGIEDMKNLAVSQVIEQIANIVISLVFAFLLIKVSIEWGSAGGTVGTTVGAIIAVVYIIYIYNKYDYEDEAIENDNSDKQLSDKKILKKLIAYGLPIILVAGMQNASSLVDAIVVKGKLLDSGFTESEASIRYAVLVFYNTLLYVPLAIVTALSSAVFPKIIQAFTSRNRKELKVQIAYTYKLTYLITIPSAFGLAILSKEIYIMIFGSTNGYNLLMYGSVVLILMSITTIQNTILQGINKLYLVLTTAFIGVVIKLVIESLLVGIKEINILGAVIATFFTFLIPAIINQNRLRRIFRIKIPVIRLAIIPFISSCVMGIVIYSIRMPLNRLINIFEGGRLSITFMVLFLVAIGGIVYLLISIFLGGITKKDLDGFSPKLFTLLPRFLRKKM